MQVTLLTLERFRSYASATLDLTCGELHLFVGPNGVGKTNILEALSILSEGGSGIGRDAVDIVQWGETFYRIRATLKSDDASSSSVEVVSETFPRRRRAQFIRDVAVQSHAFIGTLPTVLFLPQDLDLFTGAPMQRRALLDRTLGQIFPAFRRSRDVYDKALRQRSSCLRQIAKGLARREDIAPWDQILAHEGAAITLRRIELLGVLQCTLGEELAALGEHWPDAHFSYERTGEGLQEADIERELLQALERGYERDFLLQTTGTGPHRDDWGMCVDGRSLPTFASRGQQRSAMLAMLLLLGSYVELVRGEKPVILLDDVLSELDEAHQQALLSSCTGHQVLLTATHVPSGLSADAMIWNVEKGSVMCRQGAKIR